MSDDHWPPIKVERFDSEAIAEYRRRRDAIVHIITGFRFGRFEGDEAEAMEQRLIELQEGLATDLPLPAAAELPNSVDRPPSPADWRPRPAAAAGLRAVPAVRELDPRG